MKNQSVDIADFHSHILPRADHGSDSVDTSLFQLKAAGEHGVSRILATPHFYPHKHTVSEFIERRKRSVAALLEKKNELLPEVKIGAEVLLCAGLENLKELDALCFEGTDRILLELPMSDFRTEYCTTVKNIIKSGFGVILAHVDRYPSENIERMIDVGVSELQLNASSLSTLFKNKKLYEWIERELVVALGSDIHGKDAKAYKRFVTAKSKLGELAGGVKLASDKIWETISPYSV